MTDFLYYMKIRSPNPPNPLASDSTNEGEGKNWLNRTFIPDMEAMEDPVWGRALASTSRIRVYLTCILYSPVVFGFKISLAGRLYQY